MEVVLYKEIAVDSVQHLGPIDFVGLVIYIYLCWMQKTKLKVEGIVFQVNKVRGDISREHSVQIVVLMICMGKEIFGKVPKPLRKLWIDREVKAL